MDEAVFRWFNSWNGHHDLLVLLTSLARTEIFKAVPFMLVFWALWFWRKSPDLRVQVREGLVATLILSALIIGVTRAIASVLPFTARPMHTPDFDVILYPGQNIDQLDGWTSMPSDHASLFLGFAVAIFTINRKAGLVMIVWAMVFVSLPRIVLGLHWPSDILVGWLIGATLALLLIKPLTRLVHAARIVPFFEAREMIGYPLLFLATHEFARMFDSSRRLVDSLLG